MNMKRILSLVLAVVMVAVLFCGCSTEYSAKVSKNGKTKITVKVAIPVETIEERAFENCNLLETIHFETNSKICDILILAILDSTVPIIIASSAIIAK